MIDQQTRQKALQGLYLPEPDTQYYAIGVDGELTGECIATGEKNYYIWKQSGGVKFFPDEQTRTEHLQVGEGTWLPKKDDLFCSYEREDSMNVFPKNGANLATAACNYSDIGWIYAPSWKQLAEQRASFIAKRKGEEPKESPYLNVEWAGLGNGAPSGPSPFQKLGEDSGISLVRKDPKPQTITICISDEAIERAEKITSACEFDNQTDALKVVIALLHLEYTLSQ